MTGPAVAAPNDGSMMRFKSLLILAGSLLVPSAALLADSPTTAPSKIEVRAMEEFNRGQYALALPMLKQAVTEVQSQPDRVSALQENIRVCEKNLNAPPPAVAQQLASIPAAPASLSAGRTPHPKPVPGQVQEMAIKELGNFDYDADKGGNIPPDVLAMSGSKIRLNGYMIPMDQAESITEFALVPSLFSCCYGQPPQIQHTIVVHVPKGKAVSYYPDEITVEGTLTVDEKKEDGFIVSIFEVDTTSVKPAAK
jgi:hypothetical protein